MKHPLLMALLMVPAVAGLTACLGSAPPVPRDHYYRVMVTPPKGATASQTASIENAPVLSQGILGLNQWIGKYIGQHNIALHRSGQFIRTKHTKLCITHTIVGCVLSCREQRLGIVIDGIRFSCPQEACGNREDSRATTVVHDS